MKAVLWLFLPAVVLSQCITDDDKKATSGDGPLLLFKGQQKFSIDMLNLLNENYKGQNIFFSPHSIYQSVLLSYIIAGNETEASLLRALNLPENYDKLDVVQSYQQQKYLEYTRQLNSSTDYEFSTCNKLFVAEDVHPKECLRQILTEEIESVNMQEPTAARNHINQWIETKTKNHIKDLIPIDGVQNDTKLILANAAYFKGLWKSKFLPENTKKNSLFYVSSDDIKIVDMMSQKGTFGYTTSEKLKAHVLELPYKGEELYMIVILPRFEDNSIDKLIKQLTLESFYEVLYSLYPREIEVQIPKFSVEKTLDLRPVFNRLGLSDVFDENADFSGLTGEANDVRFTDAIHKAKVEVNEEGTVAAAATAIFTFRSSRPLDPTRFIANHPFVYFIYDKVTQNVLFMGVFKVPDKKYRNGKKIRTSHNSHRRGNSLHPSMVDRRSSDGGKEDRPGGRFVQWVQGMLSRLFNNE